MMTASLEFWHEYVSESNYYCLTVLPPISAVCEHENPEKLSKTPFLRHFTSFYGSVWTILFRMCSITFFDFYTIYVIGLGQKICTLTKFPKQPGVNIHKSLCEDALLQSLSIHLLFQIASASCSDKISSISSSNYRHQ